jgi:hypothetical protein
MAGLFASTAPADTTSKRLDVKHRDNFNWMLRSMNLHAGDNIVAGPQSTLNMTHGAPIGRDTGGLEDEAKPFEPIAYGATLGLVYYRAIGPAARFQWDAAMQREIKDGLNGHRTAMEARRQLSMDMAVTPGISSNPDWIRRRDANALTIQNFARYSDFMLTLQQKKNAVFPGANEELLNKPEVIGRNPWCLGTKPEFTDAYKQVFGSPGTATPSFYTGAPAEKETLAQNAAKMFGKAVEAKVTEYLSLFLEKGSEVLLKGALREGMNYVCKFPVVDLLVDWLKDRMAERELAELKTAYALDMDRRKSLCAKGWGVNPALDNDVVLPSDRRAAAAQSLR